MEKNNNYLGPFTNRAEEYIGVYGKFYQVYMESLVEMNSIYMKYLESIKDSMSKSVKRMYQQQTRGGATVGEAAGIDTKNVRVE